MPRFIITSSPVQVAQAINDGASIQNVGASVVYLDRDTNPSAANYSQELSPGSSIQWPSRSALWAVTAEGESSAIAVGYGIEGSAIGSVVANISGPVTAEILGPVDANITNAVVPVAGNVNAAITNASLAVTGNVNATITNASLAVTGNVNAAITGGTVAISSGNVNVGTIAGNVTVGGILTPVTVQGGGDRVYSGSVAAGANVNVPMPTGGNVYQSMIVSVYRNGTEAAVNTGYLLFSGLGTIGYTQALTRESIGTSDRHIFVIPWSAPTSPTVLLTINNVVNAGTGVSYYVVIDGSNQPAPIGGTTLIDSAQYEETLQGLPPSGTAIQYFPPSYNPYFIRMYFSGTTIAGSFTLQYFNQGSWHNLSSAIQTEGVPIGVAFSGTSNSGHVTYIPVPGLGFPVRIVFGGAATNAGSVYLSLKELAS